MLQRFRIVRRQIASRVQVPQLGFVEIERGRGCSQSPKEVDVCRLSPQAVRRRT